MKPGEALEAPIGHLRTHFCVTPRNCSLFQVATSLQAAVNAQVRGSSLSLERANKISEGEWYAEILGWEEGLLGRCVKATRSMCHNTLALA